MISQKTKKMYLIGIVLIILILGIWWWMTINNEGYNNIKGYNIKEGYNNKEDKEELGRKTMELAALKMKKDKTFVDEMNIEIYEKTLRAEEDAVEVADAIEDAIDDIGDVGDDVFGAIESEVIRDEKKKKMPEWRDVYGAGDKPAHIMEVKYRPDTSKIINDSCSTKGFLTSEYKEDICTKYQGDYEKINEKCGRLSKDNCAIPDCCVLLNSSKCAAGNIHGPTYLTNKGKTIDYEYYHYKGECYGPYGRCDRDNNSLSECTKYANNSTGVSKECMIQMFNNMGCPNKNPEELINDDMVRDFSRSSRRYITNYLEGAVTYINDNPDRDESRILCYGPTKKCDRFKDQHINVSKDCIEEMLTESKCPRTTITKHEENMYRKYTKENLRYDTNVCRMGVSNVDRELENLMYKINSIYNSKQVTNDNINTLQTISNAINSYFQSYVYADLNTDEIKKLEEKKRKINDITIQLQSIIDNSDKIDIIDENLDNIRNIKTSLINSIRPDNS